MYFSSYIILFLIIALVVYYFTTRQKHSKPLPPGPRGWELVRAFLSSLNGQLVYDTKTWAHKYGEVVFCPLPLGNLLFLNTPSATKELYTGKATEKFTNDRSWSYAADVLCHRKCVGFSSPADPSWTKMRKLLVTKLKIYGEGEQKFEKTVAESLSDLMTTLDSECGQDIEMLDYIDDSLHSTIGILLTGGSQDKAQLQAMKKFNLTAIEILNPAFSFAVRVCPFVDHIPGTYFTKTRRKLEHLKAEVMKHYFEDMRSTRVPGSPRGIVDHMLEYQSTEGADWMTDDHVKGILMDIIVAGIIGTTHALNACVFYLVHHQDVMRKIQEEVDRVIGPGRKPMLNDRPSCHYTEAFVWETLRCSGLSPLGLDHFVIQDVELRGFHIPKGAATFNAVYAACKSSDLWSDPDSFKPERFLDQEGHLVPADHPNRQSVLTFGVGKRSCIGENFARARIFLYVTTLLQHFDILPPAKEKLLPIEKDSWTSGTMMSLKPFHCRLHRRQMI